MLELLPYYIPLKIYNYIQIMPEVVNLQRYGSLPKSTSMSGVKAVRSCDEHRHKRRASLPSGAIQSSKTGNYMTYIPQNYSITIMSSIISTVTITID